MNFKFAQSDFTKAFLSIKDAQDSSRWDIPEDVVPKMKENENFRLEMAGLNVNYEPFEFYYKDTAFNEILIDSRKQDFVFQDKFLMIEFKLTSQEIYGFGESNRRFPLGQGAWTMFANG